MPVLTGIDLSTHNKVKDYEKLANDYDFFILRGGYGKNNIDGRYYAHCNGIYSYNQSKPIMLYWFSYGSNGDLVYKEGRYAAMLYKNTREKAGSMYPIIWYDLEYEWESYNKYKLTSTTCKALFKSFAEGVYNILDGSNTAEKVNVGIYCNKDFYNRYTREFIESLSIPVWFAYYNASLPDDIKPMIWQRSETHKDDNIIGNVDLNLWMKEDVEMKKGWIMEDGYWYYYENGNILTGLQTINGQLFLFAEDGRMYRSNADGSLVISR